MSANSVAIGSERNSLKESLATNNMELEGFWATVEAKADYVRLLNGHMM